MDILTQMRNVEGLLAESFCNRFRENYHFVLTLYQHYTLKYKYIVDINPQKAAKMLVFFQKRL